MTSSEAVPYTLFVLIVTVALFIFLFHLLTRGLNTSITEQRKENSNNSERVPVSVTPWQSSQSGTPQCFTPSLPFSHPFPDHHPLPSYSDLANWDSNTDSKKKLLQSLCREACSKAKDAGRHPSYVPLCLNLVHDYTLDVNSPVLSNGLSIFLCSCLSGCEELVSSLLPLADLSQTTDHGETALYLAVYAAAHRSLTEQAGGEVPVIQLLLEAGVEIDTPNLAGMTALQVASRKGCLGLARLLLDWGASPQEVLPDIKDAGTITSLWPTSDQRESLDHILMSSYRDSSISKTRGSALSSTTCTSRSSLNSTKENSSSVPDSPMTTRSSSLTTTMNTSGTALDSTIFTPGMEQEAVEESSTAKNLGACSRDKLDMKQKEVPRIQGAIQPGSAPRQHGTHKQQGASRQQGTSKEQGASREVGQVREHGAARAVKKRKLFSESMGGPRILE